MFSRMENCSWNNFTKCQGRLVQSGEHLLLNPAIRGRLSSKQKYTHLKKRIFCTRSNKLRYSYSKSYATKLQNDQQRHLMDITSLTLSRCLKWTCSPKIGPIKHALRRMEASHHILYYAMLQRTHAT